MNITPKISFIIPIYNTERYLTQCIDSVLAQRIDKEIILIDDGSTDSSLNVAKEYAKKYPFITVIHSKNEGLSAARNKGIRLAKGDYLYFVDSDDYLVGNALSKAYQIATENEAEIVKLQCELFSDIDPNMSILYPPVLKCLDPIQIYSGYQFLALAGDEDNYYMPAVCWSLIKRSFLLKHHLFFIEGIKAEDQIFYVQLLSTDPKVRVIELPHLIYRYRQRVNSLSKLTNDISYLQDLNRVIRWLQQWYSQHHFPKETHNAIYHIAGRLFETITKHFVKLPQEIQTNYRYLLDTDPKSIKHILVVHKSLVTGGSESVLLNYLKILAKIPHYHIHLLLHQNLAENIHIEQLLVNIKVTFLLNHGESCTLNHIEQQENYQSNADFLALRQTMRERMNGYLAENSLDCVVNFNTHFDFFLERFQVELPVIRWVHGILDLQYWLGSRHYYQTILPKHSAIIALNPEMQSLVESTLQQLDLHIPCHTLFNPLDIADIVKKSQILPACPQDLALLSQPFLLQVARLERGKNHKQLIDIFAKLKQKGIEHKLYIIGDGEMFDELSQYIAQLGLQNECLLLGKRSNPYVFMQKADLFLHTSLGEGLPMVLMESMVCGTPVVAMHCLTGVADILGNGKYGCLIQLGDTDGFVNAVEQLLNDRRLIVHYQALLDEAVERFEMGKIECDLVKVLTHYLVRNRPFIK